MPIDLPLEPPEPLVDECTVSSDTQLSVGPAKPPTLFEEPLVEQLRSLSIQHGQPEYVLWQMRTAAGFKVDLTHCTSALLRIRDGSNPALSGCDACVEFESVITSPEQGIVTTQISDPQLITYPGIYEAEVAVMDDNGIIVMTNSFYLIFERSLFSRSGQLGAGPITIPEIRMQIRDSSPNENLMLNSAFFSDAEIAAAIIRPIDYWNEALPPVASFCVHTFPFRENWRRATVAILFEMAEESYRRNALAIQQGGISVDETQKFQWYQQKGMAMWQAWETWVRNKKLSINLESAFSSNYSEYLQSREW